ncbi:conserved protein of unknown function [Hyphomicrobium sp. MC1]|nr:conserved protein of unknown function [Hyphomicrobium sp. MC1]
MAYTVKALAEHWSCSPKHVYNLIDAGQLHPFYIGKRRGTRISEGEVERWEKSQSNLTQTTASPSDGNPTPRNEFGGLRNGMMRSLASGGGRG